MEKFGILNLLKAIDGLKNLSEGEKDGGNTDKTAIHGDSASPSDSPPQRGNKDNAQTYALPNIMYETLMRHETVSNRLRNRK